jgi:hypothetical protein
MRLHIFISVDIEKYDELVTTLTKRSISLDIEKYDKADN